MTSGPITLWQIDGAKVETMTNFIFLVSKVTADDDCIHKIKRLLILGRKDDKHRQCIKKQRHHFTDKGPYSQSYGLPSNHVWMWKLDYKEGWTLKNWCFSTVVLEKILESLLDCRVVNAVNSKGFQPWTFIGRTDAEAEVPIFWPPDVKNWFTGEDSDAGKDWGQEKKEVTEDKVVGWHHWLNGKEFEQILGASEPGEPDVLQFLGS